MLEQMAKMCVELEKAFNASGRKREDIKRAYVSLFAVGCTEELGTEGFYNLCDRIKNKNRDESIQVQPPSRGRNKLFKS